MELSRSRALNSMMNEYHNGLYYKMIDGCPQPLPNLIERNFDLFVINQLKWIIREKL
jgi:hypothetical protein